MSARLQFSLSAAPSGARRRDGDDGPRRLLLLGDFSGQPAAGRPPLATRPTRRVDIDTLDAVIARCAPSLDLAGTPIAFASLDDFHPDALHARLPQLAALRSARTQPAASGGALLGSLLGAAPAAAAPAAAAPPAAGLDALLQRIVAPHVVPDTQAQDRAHVAGVDAATGDALRALLHDPGFQALEAAWRGVHWLVANLPLDDGTLELHLFDVTRDELIADVVASQGRLAETGLHRALADRWRNQPGAAGWSMLVGLQRFGGSEADVGLLAALGLIASQAGGAYVAEADPALAEAPTAAWQALRASEAAPWLGLAAPRLLLRLPYGAKTDPVSTFAFEEIPGAPAHAHFLWGPAALAVAMLAGRGEDAGVIDDLPAYSYTDADGEKALLPCAERFLGEAAAGAMLAAGLIPVASHRHRAAVTLPRLQSVALPAQPLGGA